MKYKTYKVQFIFIILQIWLLHEKVCNNFLWLVVIMRVTWRELDEIWSKKNFHCEKVYTSLTFCNSCGEKKLYVSTNYLQYLLWYCNFNKDQFVIPFLRLLVVTRVRKGLYLLFILLHCVSLCPRNFSSFSYNGESSWCSM